MASTSNAILPESTSPVTAMKSFMSHFVDRPSVTVTRPDQSAAPLADPLPSRSGLAEAPSLPETPAVLDTPAETRGMAVAARIFPALAYGQRRTLVRAIARMTEHPDSPRFEREIRAAYVGAVVEVPVTDGGAR